MASPPKLPPRPAKYMYGWDNLVQDLSPNHLIKICHNISNCRSSTKLLAAEFDLTQGDLDSTDIPRRDNPAYGIIEMWWRKHPTTSTIRCLKHALEAMHRNDVVEQLKKAMLNPFNLLVVIRERGSLEGREMKCAVEGLQSLRDAILPGLLNIGLNLDDLRIKTPSDINWDIPSHKLKGQQLDLEMRRPGSVHSDNEYEEYDNYAYCNIYDDLAVDLRSDPNLSARSTSMSFSDLPSSPSYKPPKPSLNNLNISSGHGTAPSTTSYNVTDETSRWSVFSSDPPHKLPEPPKFVDDTTRENVYVGPPSRSLDRLVTPVQATSSIVDTGTYLTIGGAASFISPCPAYWPNLGQTKREIKSAMKKELKTMVDGHFLVRSILDDNDPSVEFAISITCRGRLKHFLIHKDIQSHGSKFFLFKDGHRASSISALIEYYKDSPLCPPASAVIEGAYGDTRNLKLKHPVSPPPKLEPLAE